ncbi:MAG: stability/partitioning determinant [Rhodospirillales bacterium]|nr:stability/partitioning determinant [Rhodospirillales bacterium]
MERERTDLGFADTLDEFDPAEWLPKPATANDKPPKAETKKAAAAAGFRSREPLPVVEAPHADLPRRRRTGRNMQLNLKARPETIAAFCAIADSHDWGLGETLEHAVALLEREHNKTV